MKVTNAHLRVAILSLGGVLLLFMVFKLILGFSFGAFIDENLPNTMLFLALGVFLWNRQLVKEERTRQAAEARKKAETDAGADADQTNAL